MQNRYTCDVGDFAKYGLMRSFNQAGFKTALAWYLFPDEGHNSDGKHIDYIGRDDFIRCDPQLHDKMKTMISKENRHISAIEKSKILGADTLFHSDKLDFKDLPRLQSKAGMEQRKARREKWLFDCLAKTEGAELVFFDPDNGFEISSTKALGDKGPKFLYWSDLYNFTQREQSLVIYNHAGRQGTVYDQIASRLSEIRKHIPYGKNAVAMLWRKFSVRYFFVIPTNEMKDRVLSACREMLDGPWGQRKFFELVKD